MTKVEALNGLAKRYDAQAPDAITITEALNNLAIIYSGADQEEKRTIAEAIQALGTFLPAPFSAPIDEHIEEVFLRYDKPAPNGNGGQWELDLSGFGDRLKVISISSGYDLSGGKPVMVRLVNDQMGWNGTATLTWHSHTPKALGLYISGDFLTGTTGKYLDVHAEDILVVDGMELDLCTHDFAKMTQLGRTIEQWTTDLAGAINEVYDGIIRLPAEYQAKELDIEGPLLEKGWALRFE